MIEKIAKTASEKVDGALEIIEAEKAEDVVESKLKKVPQKTLKAVKFSVKTVDFSRRKLKLNKKIKTRGKEDENDRL
mgnify:CR=1 FL=1